MDNRNTHDTSKGDLYAVRVDRNGTVLDETPIYVTWLDQAYDQVAVASDGDGWIVVWKSVTTGDWFGQHVAADGTLVDLPFPGTYAAVGGDGLALEYGDGAYLLAWHDDRSGSDDIYAQRIGTDGTLLGSELTITNEATSQSAVVMAYGDNRWLLVWRDDRLGSASWPFGQLVGSDGTPIGSNFQLSPTRFNGPTDLVYGDGVFLAISDAKAIRLDTHRQRAGPRAFRDRRTQHQHRHVRRRRLLRVPEAVR